MSIKFQNHDTKIIKLLLAEIGEYKYNKALELMQVGDSRPLSMKGFYIEATEFYMKLCYMYPSRFKLMIMDVNKYENIPRDGWIRIKD